MCFSSKYIFFPFNFSIESQNCPQLCSQMKNLQKVWLKYFMLPWPFIDDIICIILFLQNLCKVSALSNTKNCDEKWYSFNDLVLWSIFSNLEIKLLFLILNNFFSISSSLLFSFSTTFQQDYSPSFFRCNSFYPVQNLLMVSYTSYIQNELWLKPYLWRPYWIMNEIFIFFKINPLGIQHTYSNRFFMSRSTSESPFLDMLSSEWNIRIRNQWWIGI